jgi:hypothetical protein
MRQFIAAAVLASSMLLAPVAAQAGFTVKLFSDPVDTGSDVTFGTQSGEFIADAVSFFSNDTSGSPGWPLASQVFGAEVTGFLFTDLAGEFPLYLGSDDGAYLFVNGVLAISRPGTQGYSETERTVALNAGYNTFRISSFNGPCCGSGLTLVADDRVTITPVPEPGTYALMGAGLAVVGAGVASRRRKQVA